MRFRELMEFLKYEKIIYEVILVSTELTASSLVYFFS